MARSSRLRILAEKVFPFSPSLALRIADARGRFIGLRAIRRPSNLVPSQKKLEALLGKSETLSYPEYVKRCARSVARTRMVKRLSHRKGPASLLPLIQLEGNEHLLRIKEQGLGALIVTWHTGPTPAVWAALIPSGVPLMKMQGIPWPHVPDNWEIIIPGKDPFESIRVLRRSQKHLKRGGWLGVAMDVKQRQAHGVPVSCFGRRAEFQAGFVALAGINSCPIVPISARWDIRKPAIVVHVHPPIFPDQALADEREPEVGEWERRTIQEVAKCMEDECRRYSWEMNASRIGKYLAWPRV